MRFTRYPLKLRKKKDRENRKMDKGGGMSKVLALQELKSFRKHSGQKS